MTNQLSKLKGGELSADIRAKLEKHTEEERGRIGSGTSSTITINNGKRIFIMPDGTEVKEFVGVIADFGYANTYYLGAYNPKDIQPPACFAIAAAESDLIPSENSPVKQSETSCRDCQQNEYGSHPTRGGKACKNNIRLAILPADPALVETHPIWVLSISPTALKAFNGYAGEVNKKLGLPLAGVKTQFFFDPEVDFASVRFDAVELAGDCIEAVLERKEEAALRLLEEPDVSQFKMPAAEK